MWQGLLFASLGVFGSALPGHIGMRILAFIEQRDRHIDYEPGTENGGLAYSWWLMQGKHRQFVQAKTLKQFGNLSALFGWVSLLGVAASVLCFIMDKS